MAVYHMVWMKFADDVPAQRIQAHLDALRALPTHVPEIEKLTCGRNFTDRANGFTHGMLVELRDREALAGYAGHPHHVEVVSALRRDAQLMALDYED